MADISRITTLDGTTYDVKDAVARETKMPIVTFGDPIVLIDTTTISFSKDGDNAWYISSENPLTDVSGSQFTSYSHAYLVEWDGVEYELYLKHVTELKGVRQVSGSTTTTFSWEYLGNVSPLGYGGLPEDRAAPFAVLHDYQKNSGEVYIVSHDTESSHTVKITKVPFTKAVVDPVLYADTGDGFQPVRFGTGDLSTIEGDAIIASGSYSHAEGSGTSATAMGAHAEGGITTASGTGAHAEGVMTVASGVNGSHAEGRSTTASAASSHAEGQATEASGNVSHAEGNHVVASGSRSHAEGEYTIANHHSQHVFGQYNVADPSSEAATARGNYVEIVGNGTAEALRSNARTLDWDGNEALAGSITLGKGDAEEFTATASWLSGRLPIVTYGTPVVVVDTTTVSFSKDGDHDWYVSSANPLTDFTTSSSFVDSAVFVVEWDGTEYKALSRMHRDVTSTALTYSFYSIGSISPLGYAGFPEDGFPFAVVRSYLNANNVLVFSYDTEASHTIKITKIPFTRTLIDDTYFLKSHRQLSAVRVCLGSSNDFGIAEGYAKSASFAGAHAEGLGTDSRQLASHAEGCGTIAGGYSCHAEGLLTITSGNYAHSEGLFSSASEEASHAEGRSTSASGKYSHSEGRDTSASGWSSHAEGESTVANHRNQHVFGRFNVADPSSENSETIGNYAEIVGNGTANNSRSNARTLDWSGNEVLSGGLTVNSTSGITIGQTTVNETELAGMKGMIDLSSNVYTKSEIDTMIGNIETLLAAI